MSAEIITLNVTTVLPIPVEKILSGAATEDLADVFVIGRRKNGKLYLATSTPDGGDLLWLMEKAKAVLMEEAE